MAAEGHRRGWEAVAVQAVTALLTWRTRQRRRGVTVPFNRVVKPEYRRQGEEMLERRIYHLP